MCRACGCDGRDKEYMKNFGGEIDWAFLERSRKRCEISFKMNVREAEYEDWKDLELAQDSVLWRC
jgi:hypothetical protein